MAHIEQRRRERPRPGVLALLASAALGAIPLAWVPGAGARAQVVGGSLVDIQQAPWHVAVIQERGSRFTLCGGSIIDEQRVVTAAHCAYGPNGQPAAPAVFSIRAGVSNFLTPRATDVEQRRGVTSYRIHPGYSFSSAGSPDDVAVLTLDAPLDLGGPSANAIALPTPATPVAPGAAVSLAGFGREAAGGDPDGTLNRFDGALADRAACGPNNAVVVCASSPVGSVCSGDSGSALTLSLPERVLVGIASTGPVSCGVGATGVFTSLSAPEILRFVQGDDNPPTAPRRLVRASLTVPEAMQVGQVVGCSPGSWSGSPTFRYTFLDVETGMTLQTGAAATYTLRLRDRGILIACRASAETPGGVGYSESEASLLPVQPAAEVTAPTVAARRGGRAAVLVTFSGASGVRGRAEVCVRPSPRVGGKVCRTTRLVGAPRTTTSVRLPLKQTAPAVLVRVAVVATLADGRRLTTTGRIRVSA